MQRSRLFRTLLCFLVAAACGCAQYLGYDIETRELYTDWELKGRELRELSIDFEREPRMENPRLIVKATCESVDDLSGLTRVEKTKIKRYTAYKFAD